MTSFSLLDRAFSQECPSPTTCSAVNINGKGLCSKKCGDADSCYSHRELETNVAQGRIVAELVTRSGLVGLGKQATIPVVIKFVQTQWEELYGDRIRIAQAWFNSLETQPVPPPQKSPSLQLDSTPIAARRSSTSVAFGSSSPLASIALEEKDSAVAASIDPIDIDETRFYDTRSKSSGWMSYFLGDSISDAKSTARADAPSEDHFPTSQSALDPIPTMADVSGTLHKLRTSASKFQPRVYHSSKDMDDGFEAIDLRLDEILGKISALSIRLDQLQLVAFGSLEVQCILVDKLQHVVVSAHTDKPAIH